MQSAPIQRAGPASPLDRLKLIQAQFKTTWVGINTDFSGKPGTSSMCNSERVFPQSKQEIEEEVRANKFLRIFATLRNVEQDYPLLISN